MDVIPSTLSDDAQAHSLVMSPEVEKLALQSLRNLWRLYAKDEHATIALHQLRELIRSCFGDKAADDEVDEAAACEAALACGAKGANVSRMEAPPTPTIVLSDALMTFDEIKLRLTGSLGASPESAITFDTLRKLLFGSTFRGLHRDRYQTLVSLSEAETLRRIVHLRQDKGGALLDEGSTSLALRLLPADMRVLDSSVGYLPPPRFQTAITQQALRFFDGELYFTENQLKFLLAGIQVSLTFL